MAARQRFAGDLVKREQERTDGFERHAELSEAAALVLHLFEEVRKRAGPRCGSRRHGEQCPAVDGIVSAAVQDGVEAAFQPPGERRKIAQKHSRMPPRSRSERYFRRFHGMYGPRMNANKR